MIWWVENDEKMPEDFTVKAVPFAWGAKASVVLGCVSPLPAGVIDGGDASG